MADLAPRLAVVPKAEPTSSPDGFGPDSLGRRMPAVVLPPKLVAACSRLMVEVPSEEIEAMVNALADRYKQARERRESFEVTIVARGHDGQHKEFRWNEDRRL